MPGEPLSALLIDLDGVLYQGEEAVSGAVDAVNWLQDRGIPHLFLTNTTSRPREAIVSKLTGLGLAVATDHIQTPVIATREWLQENAPGPVAAFMPEATVADLGEVEMLPDDSETGAAAVIIGDLGSDWTYTRLNRAFRLLMAEPAPALIALGLTRYWRAPDGLRLDVAPFVKALEHAAGCEALVLGKPSPAFFEAALLKLGCTAGQSLMLGDDIKGDVFGAQDAGLRAALVKTGKFQPRDLDGKRQADVVLDSIADLPGWWDEHT